MTSSESEEHVPSTSRKRSRKSNSGEDAAGVKKARGRPRVDTQDATAADRRRTQIRLAQRAYRQRKETTISSLQNQSTQLHSIIEQMNKTFLRLSQSALKSGWLQLNPALAQEFKLVTETFTILIKTASEVQYEVDEDGGAGEQAPDQTDAQKPSKPEAEPQHIGWGYSIIPDATSRVSASESQRIHTQPQPDNYLSYLAGAHGKQRTNTASLVRLRHFTVGDVLDQSRYSQASSLRQKPSNDTTQEQLQLPFGLVDLLSQQQAPFTPPNPHIYSTHIPTPDVTPPVTRLSTPPLQLPSISTKTLPPVTTFSFEETSFSRRLTRAGLEKGFLLLSNADARPVALNYVFKLSLPYLSVEQLRTRSRTIMMRGLDEDLDWWDTPFLHMGGAGTHYPRRDATGRIIQMKNGWTVRQIGPKEKKHTRLQNTADGRVEELNGVDLSGFEGEWFDSHDVQGYLEEQYACKLDPNSSFSECLVDADDDKDTATPSSLPQHQQQQYDTSIRRPPDEDFLPSLAHTATHSSTNSSASITTPGNPYNLPDTAPFGLDMSFDTAPTPNYASDFPKLTNYDISFDQTLGLDLAPGFDYGFSGSTVFHMGNMDLGLDLMGEGAESLPVVRQKKKKSAWVEVSKLVEEIIKHGVCLGRAPGFRREDVDAAVQLALVHSL
ncbi:hypothetical protein EJ02DRAFT_123357 [Clathrospora elynae]|uniref:BZIP domain-containing protein n=1 Tax=Clathrospora elynae TaxID=706981 RepID=A0A6A5S7S2_9PLEO|nr:hypothetical protein EJ02DRAFT_123357 [Clathrospora elynae]